MSGMYVTFNCNVFNACDTYVLKELRNKNLEKEKKSWIFDRDLANSIHYVSWHSF